MSRCPDCQCNECICNLPADNRDRLESLEATVRTQGERIESLEESIQEPEDARAMVARIFGVMREGAGRAVRKAPTEEMLNYKYICLHGAWMLALELGVQPEELGQSPNDWAAENRVWVAAGK